MKQFKNILPQNSIKRLLDVVLKNAKPELRDRLKKSYAIGIKNATSDDADKADKGQELLVTLLQELRARELEAEITITKLDAGDVLDVLENLGKLALGMLVG